MAKRGERFLQAIRRLEGPAQRAFIETVARARGAATQARLTALLAEGKLDEAFRLAVAAWESASAEWRLTVGRQLRDALEAGAAVAGRVTGVLEGRFDVTNPEAVRWAQQESASLVTRVTAETRVALRAIVMRSVREGIAPVPAARLIQNTVGLTARQEVAVASFRARLQTLQARPAGAAVETAVGRVANRALSDRIPGLVARYAQRLLAQRALVIARTEILAAANEGQRQLWEQAVQTGEVDREQVEREWIVTDDERLCELCEPLEGARADIGGTFPRGGGAGPPLHPQCRCTEGLVVTTTAAVRRAS
jgi:Phage Mu protein F like protein